jgi:hypothetical protein
MKSIAGDLRYICHKNLSRSATTLSNSSFCLPVFPHAPIADLGVTTPAQRW